MLTITGFLQPRISRRLINIVTRKISQPGFDVSGGNEVSDFLNVSTISETGLSQRLLDAGAAPHDSDCLNLDL